MIKEAYCSYEIYKLLRKKEFDGVIHATYDDKGYIQPSITHQMACAWLREKHNILIIPRWIYNNNNSTIVYGYTIFKVFPLPYKDYSSERIWYIEHNEAIEAALKYTLENLIGE
jgi:hypothetical protein